MLLLIPLFVGCFYGRANDSDTVKRVFQILAKVLGCLSLFFFGNVLKTFAAKAMSSHFHKEAHFEKMQEALVKVCICVHLRLAVAEAAWEDEVKLPALLAA